MKNWVHRVLQMDVYVRQDDHEGRNGTQGGLERADVVWAVWSDDGETPVIRIISGRDRDGPDLSRANHPISTALLGSKRPFQCLRLKVR